MNLKAFNTAKPNPDYSGKYITHTIDGEEFTLTRKQWSEKLNIHPSTLQYRIVQRMTLKQIMGEDYIKRGGSYE